MGDATIAETRDELNAILRDEDRKRRLYALAKRFARGPNTADDLIQTACVKVLSGAFEACRDSRWDACLTWLDEAAQLDPAGDAAPEVVDARKAAKKGEEDDAQKLKPHAP